MANIQPHAVTMVALQRAPQISFTSIVCQVNTAIGNSLTIPPVARGNKEVPPPPRPHPHDGMWVAVRWVGAGWRTLSYSQLVAEPRSSKPGQHIAL